MQFLFYMKIEKSIYKTFIKTFSNFFQYSWSNIDFLEFLNFYKKLIINTLNNYYIKFSKA